MAGPFPRDIWNTIISYMSDAPLTVVKMSSICKFFWNLNNSNDSHWKAFYEKTYGLLPHPKHLSSSIRTDTYKMHFMRQFLISKGMKTGKIRSKRVRATTLELRANTLEVAVLDADTLLLRPKTEYYGSYGPPDVVHGQVKYSLMKGEVFTHKLSPTPDGLHLRSIGDLCYIESYSEAQFFRWEGEALKKLCSVPGYWSIFRDSDLQKDTKVFLTVHSQHPQPSEFYLSQVTDTMEHIAKQPIPTELSGSALGYRQTPTVRSYMDGYFVCIGNHRAAASTTSRYASLVTISMLFFNVDTKELKVLWEKKIHHENGFTQPSCLLCKPVGLGNRIALAYFVDGETSDSVRFLSVENGDLLHSIPLKVDFTAINVFGDLPTAPGTRTRDPPNSTGQQSSAQGKMQLRDAVLTAIDSTRVAIHAGSFLQIYDIRTCELLITVSMTQTRYSDLRRVLFTSEGIVIAGSERIDWVSFLPQQSQ